MYNYYYQVSYLHFTLLYSPTTTTARKKPKTAVVAIFETLIWRPRVFLCNWAIVYTTLTNEYWSSTPWCRSKCIVEQVPMLHASLTMWSTRHAVAPEEVGGWPILTKISLISASQQLRSLGFHWEGSHFSEQDSKLGLPIGVPNQGVYFR